MCLPLLFFHPKAAICKSEQTCGIVDCTCAPKAPARVACAQVLQRYFTPQSAAMAEFALASAVVRRVKGASSRSGMGGEARLSPVQSLSGREGGRPSLLSWSFIGAVLCRKSTCCVNVPARLCG